MHSSWMVQPATPVIRPSSEQARDKAEILLALVANLRSGDYQIKLSRLSFPVNPSPSGITVSSPSGVSEANTPDIPHGGLEMQYAGAGRVTRPGGSDGHSQPEVSSSESLFRSATQYVQSKVDK